MNNNKLTKLNRIISIINSHHVSNHSTTNNYLRGDKEGRFTSAPLNSVLSLPTHASPKISIDIYQLQPLSLSPKGFSQEFGLRTDWPPEILIWKIQPCTTTSNQRKSTSPFSAAFACKFPLPSQFFFFFFNLTGYFAPIRS